MTPRQARDLKAFQRAERSVLSQAQQHIENGQRQALWRREFIPVLERVTAEYMTTGVVYLSRELAAQPHYHGEWKDYFEKIVDAEVTEFERLVDAWVLDYAELFAAAG